MTAHRLDRPRPLRLLLVAGLLAALLAIPAHAQSPNVHADHCDFLIFFCDLDPSGGGPATQCNLAKPAASYDVAHLTRRAAFEMLCDLGSNPIKGAYKVSVSYNESTHLAQESIRDLHTNEALLAAQWTCPRHPWQYFSSDDAAGNCSLRSLSDKVGTFQSYAGGTRPVSARMLSMAAKELLNDLIEAERAEARAAYKACYANQTALPTPVFELPYLTPQPLADGATVLIKVPAGACQSAVFELSWQWYDPGAKAWKSVKAFDGDSLPGRYELLEHPFGRTVKVPYKGTWMVKARFAPLMNEKPWAAPWATRTFTMK